MSFEDGAKQHSFDLVALEDAMKESYIGTKCTKLAATILFINLCTIHGVSNKFANELFALLHLQLLLEMGSYYAAIILNQNLGLNYNNIHACAKGCVFFQGNHKDVVPCPKCGGPCYKDEVNMVFPLKVLQHFLVIPRLQCMLITLVMSELMLWHSQNSSSNGLVKHPCDSKAWKHVHEKFPTFASYPRNVHLALATNGVNPFKPTCSKWSTWPIMLLNYNLPPWLTTNFFFILLALLILGKDYVTFKNFDFYLQPLVEKLQQLWTKVVAYDVLKPLGSRSFTLRASLLWTIHDFLGYGVVVGVSHQGYILHVPFVG